MPVNCDYLAVQWDGIICVRNEMCQFAKRYDGVDGVYIGARLEFRPIESMDQGKCRDMDKVVHARYKIGDKEWVCLRN
jgi:hypothetical protein